MSSLNASTLSDLAVRAVAWLRAIGAFKLGGRLPVARPYKLYRVIYGDRGAIPSFGDARMKESPRRAV